MYFIHPFWWLLDVFLCTVRLRKLRQHGIQFICLSLNGTVVFMGVSGGRTGKHLSPRITTLLDSDCSGETQGCENVHGAWPVAQDDNATWRGQMILPPAWMGLPARPAHPISNLRARSTCVDQLENHSLVTLVLEKLNCMDLQTKQIRFIST